MGERTGVYKVLMGKTEGNRPLGRPRHRREDKDGCSGSGVWGMD